MRIAILAFFVFSDLSFAVPYATMDSTAKAGDTFTMAAPYRGEAKKYALGYVRNERDRAFIAKQRRFYLKDLRGDTAIPKSFDFGNKVSPPENQGSCGSCWDFSLTKALRSALMLANKDPGTLAFNYLLNNCGPGPKMYGCDGGMFEAGQSFLTGHGPWLEKDDPYTQREGRCKKLPMAGTAISMEFVGDSAPSFQELAYAVSQGHMLAIDVAVAGAWGNYSGGIYNRNDAGPNGINHMINMTGYNCETSVDGDKCKFDSKGKPVNGDGYLIVENNWGSWGENGYMRTRWGMNAVAYTAAYFVVEAAPPPPPPLPVPTCSLAAAPSVAKLGDEVTLILLGNNAAKGTINGVEVSPMNGNLKVKPLATGSFAATAIVTGAGGTGSCQATYQVVAPPAPVPDGGIPAWVWIVVGVLGVVVGGLIYFGNRNFQKIRLRYRA